MSPVLNRRPYIGLLSAIALVASGAGAEENPHSPASASTSALERVPVADWPAFDDVGDRNDLLASLNQSLRYFRSLPADRPFQFADVQVFTEDMIATIERFRQLVNEPKDVFEKSLRDEFLLFRSKGTDKDKTVVFSAYYEHSLEAALKPDETYRYALYAPPADLVKATDPKNPELTMWGRKGQDGELLPYYTRKEIDSDGALKGRGLEIAWAKDPMDIFFLQVQGSGWLILPNGKQMRIRYAANNGQPYLSVGGNMISKNIIPKDKFSRESMVAFMKTHPEQRQELLNHNPRYVFFSLDSTAGPATGALRVGLTARRSVATDHSLFPPGAIAWIETSGKFQVSSFVLNQDQGGAIKGPGRVDYFVGAGKEAEDYAVRFWQPGRLYFLLRKPNDR